MFILLGCHSIGSNGGNIPIMIAEISYQVSSDHWLGVGGWGCLSRLGNSLRFKGGESGEDR